jgi:hypothetical protein
VDVVYQLPGFVVVVVLDEIGGNALAEAFGFADVQQFPAGVEIFIDAGLSGNGMRYLGKFR